MDVRSNFSKGAGNVIILLRLYFLGCWRCNASGRSQNALLFLHYTTGKCLLKARAPFASILKPFSSEAVYEFATKLYFLSSVTAFAESVHKSRYHYELHHGPRKGGKASWILKISPKKVVISVSSGKKTNFTTFGSPRKFLKKCLSGPPWKKSFRRPWTPHNWVWKGLELSTNTFAVLSLVCAGWTELTSEIFYSNCFLHFSYQKCFFFS